MNSKKVLLAELSNSHNECLYSQLLFLNASNYEVHLICNSDYSDQKAILPLTQNIIAFKFGNNRRNDWKNLFEIRKYIIQNEFNKVIFNSAGGNLIRNLLFLHFPKHIELIGILHSLIKLTNSFTQKLINRKIKKYFVLNDYILQSFKHNSSYSIESFYPIFFPEFHKYDISKEPGAFWICIPGATEYYRRDFIALMKILETEKLDKKVKFILLGPSAHFNSDAPDLKQRIVKHSLQEQFLFFEKYIPNEIFHSYIEKCDMVMPLVHSSHPFFREIDGYKISGSFNLAFAHKKPLLSEGSFKKFPDFEENAIFYELENMIEMINKLSSDQSILENLKVKLYKDPKWGFEFQRRKYLSFIEN